MGLRTVVACLVVGCGGAAAPVAPPQPAPSPAPAPAATPAPVAPPVAVAPSRPTSVDVPWPTSWDQPSVTLLRADEHTAQPLAVSGDATTVVGIIAHADEQAVPVVWRAGKRLTLPRANPGKHDTARLVSFDGKVVVGGSVWVEERELPLPQPAGDEASVAAMSSDGTILVGAGGDPEDAATWTVVRWQRGAQGYEAGAPVRSELAVVAASADGKLLAGTVGAMTNPELAYGDGAKLTRLGKGLLQAMTRDGKVFVGDDDATAFIYRGKAKTVIPKLPGTVVCHPRSVADDGKRVVGECVKRDGGTTAFLWDAGRGTRELAAVVKSSTPLVDARSICARGLTVVGSVIEDGRAQGYVAIVPR